MRIGHSVAMTLDEARVDKQRDWRVRLAGEEWRDRYRGRKRVCFGKRQVNFVRQGFVLTFRLPRRRSSPGDRGVFVRVSRVVCKKEEAGQKRGWGARCFRPHVHHKKHYVKILRDSFAVLSGILAPGPE